MDTNQTLNTPDALLRFVDSIKSLYQEPPPAPPKPGKKRDFSALSFLLLACVALTLPTFRDRELHSLLTKDDALRQAMDFCRVPHRTLIGRRLAALVPEAEQQIALLGKHIAANIKPNDEQTQVGVLDGRMYKAQGPRWHKNDRQRQNIPLGLRNVDCDSTWSKSSYRGWVQGYRLLLQGIAFPSPVPIFALWRANSINEARLGEQGLASGDLVVTDVLLGDESFGKGDFPKQYSQAGGWVLAPQQLPKKRRSWKNDLYGYRKESIELLFQRVIQATELKECKVKGEGRNGAFVLSNVWLYQICYLANYGEGKSLGHIKELVDAARWRISSG
jgi:hypothetical protein